MNYKEYIIKKGDNEIGLLWSDIRNHLLTPAQYEKFEDYMKGSTCGMIQDGPVYISICYTGDFVRFINNQPNLD